MLARSPCLPSSFGLRVGGEECAQPSCKRPRVQHEGRVSAGELGQRTLKRGRQRLLAIPGKVVELCPAVRRG